MTDDLTTTRAAALYIGALLGPSVLLLPGLAAGLAGPASILAWVGLLAVSALLARVFTVLGVRFPSRAGVAAYVRAGLGPAAGRATTACFLGGVVLGAPVVFLIGGAYVSALLGGGTAQTVTVAALLLVAVLAMSAGGARVGAGLQLALVAVLVVVVAIAVGGSVPHMTARHWTPFLPHGWSGVGSAAGVLMLSFVGWEAIAPLTARLADPTRQLPRVIGIAFAVTSTLFLALAVATVGVLGRGTQVPVADLLQVGLGAPGRVVAAVAAVALSLASVNAYVTGAGELVAELRGRTTSGGALQVTIGVVSIVAIAAVGAGALGLAQLVAIPTALFLAVYLASTAAATRLLRGLDRVAALGACLAVGGVLACSGWAVLAPLAVGAAAVTWHAGRITDFVVLKRNMHGIGC